MKIQYDKEADAKYITLHAGEKVAKTSRKEDWLIIDHNKDGRVIGIEILDASKHPSSFFIAGNNIQSLKQIGVNHKKTYPLVEPKEKLSTVEQISVLSLSIGEPSLI